MSIDVKHLFVLYLVFNLLTVQGKNKGITGVERLTGTISIMIKDHGVVEMKKGDVTMIFYITVTNIGHDPVHLSVNSTKCCQTISKEDVDCEAMRPFGGDMGELYPQDNRNLTLLYANLYLHNRVGSCDIEIKDNSGAVILQVVKFNTTLVKSGGDVHVPRLLQQYYDPDVMMTCKTIDEDPLNSCKPYACDIRYDGTRNLYNYTTNRCQKIPKCLPEQASDNQDVAYVMETSSCKVLVKAMSAEDFSEFHAGKPSAHVLAGIHSYPVNVRCHNGKIDTKGRWCDCNPGWDSAPMDHKGFNPDLQVYHMCTVWTGEMSAAEARNITALPKDLYKITNIIVFSTLGVGFVVLFVVVGCIIYRQRVARRIASAEEVLDESEVVGLTENTAETESES